MTAWDRDSPEAVVVVQRLRIEELEERLRVQDQWRKELEAENERLKQLRSNTLEYAWDCRRNGYRVMAHSVIQALEGDK